MLKKIPSDKISVTKNALLSMSRARTHYSLTFNSHLSKTVFGFSISIPARFYLILYFCLTKSMDSLTLIRLTPFKIKIIEKTQKF